jgi:hypothetical protein
MKKVLLIISGLIVLTIILCVGYLIKYQQIVNEGSEIADKQCLLVEPLIKEKNGLYNDSLQLNTASGSAEDYMKNNASYLDVSRKYIKAQEEWLSIENEFINRWDYKLIAPSYIKDLSRLQLSSRMAAVEAQKALDEAFTIKDNPLRQFALSDNVITETKKRNQADDEYNGIIKQHANRLDIRTYFVNIPVSACLDIN